MITRRPILLGIAGDSAAGKTTITQGLMNILGADCVTHVCTDDYHKYDRRERAERGITPLRPECNYIDVLEQHLERLHYGQPILKPVYEHASGTLVRPEYVAAAAVRHRRGLAGFFHADAAAVLRRQGVSGPAGKHAEGVETQTRYDPARLHDRAGAGGTGAARARLARLHPPAARVCRPRRDGSIRRVGSSPEEAGPNLNVRLVLRPTIPHPDLSYLDPNVSVLLNGHATPASGVRLQLARDEGRPVDFLEIDGDVAAQHAAELEDAMWQHLPDLRPVSDDQFGAYQDGREVRHSSPLALTQLLIAYHLLRKYSDLSQLPSPRRSPRSAGCTPSNSTPGRKPWRVKLRIDRRLVWRP